MYDVVDVDQYSEMVTNRVNDDWIVDDDLEIFIDHYKSLDSFRGTDFDIDKLYHIPMQKCVIIYESIDFKHLTAMSWAGKKFSEVVASKNDAAGVLVSTI